MDPETRLYLINSRIAEATRRAHAEQLARRARGGPPAVARMGLELRARFRPHAVHVGQA